VCTCVETKERLGRGAVRGYHQHPLPPYRSFSVLSWFSEEACQLSDVNMEICADWLHTTLLLPHGRTLACAGRYLRCVAPLPVTCTNPGKIISATSCEQYYKSQYSECVTALCILPTAAKSANPTHSSPPHLMADQELGTTCTHSSPLCLPLCWEGCNQS
jgi:hypothetical protein